MTREVATGAGGAGETASSAARRNVLGGAVTAPRTRAGCTTTTEQEGVWGEGSVCACASKDGIRSISGGSDRLAMLMASWEMCGEDVAGPRLYLSAVAVYRDAAAQEGACVG